MTVPLILLAIPSIVPRHVPRACRSATAGSTTGWSRCSSEAERAPRTTRSAEYELFGIDGVLILASVARRRDRRSPWPGASSASSSAGSGCRPAGAVREIAARVPFLYRALAQQVVVRRAQRPAVHRSSAGASRRPCGGSTGSVIDGTVNGIGGVDPGAGRGLRQVQTGRVQNYALGIAIGLHRHGRLVPRDRGPLSGHQQRPAPDAGHVPAARRAPSLVAFAAARRLDAAGRRSAFALATWVVSLLLLVGFLPGATGGFQYVETADWIPRLRHPVQARRRRAVARARRADDDADVDLHPRQLRADQDPDEGVHDLLPRSSRSG